LNTESSPVPASLLLSLETIVEPLDIGKLFLRRQPLQVELGSGDGSFLAQYAALHPEWNFIGVERLLGRLRKIERKGQRAGLANLKGVRIEASYFLEYLLPKKSATALHIYFPDPWPKRKHHKHRLINERFPQLACDALVPGGAVYLRTDDADYFAQMKTVFEACPAFAPIPTPQPLSEVLTDFERDFLARGIQTLRLAWQLAGP
jgi:tRNA (guanine-N7-)-methyltransferase